MRSAIILVIFLLLIGILFFSLFKQPIKANTTQLRLQMRAAEIEKRQSEFFERQLSRCRKDIFDEAVEFVDSLIPELNPKNELDTLKRRYRPEQHIQFEKSKSKVKLEPLFSELDSIE